MGLGLDVLYLRGIVHGVLLQQIHINDGQTFEFEAEKLKTMVQKTSFEAIIDVVVSQPIYVGPIELILGHTFISCQVQASRGLILDITIVFKDQVWSLEVKHTVLGRPSARKTV